MKKLSITVLSLSLLPILGLSAPRQDAVMENKSNESNTSTYATSGDYIVVCCLPDGTCSEIDSVVCKDNGGQYWDLEDESCESITCEEQDLGSCCLPYGGCEETYQSVCGQANWYFGLSCSSAPCNEPCEPANIFSTDAFPIEIFCGGIMPASMNNSYQNIDIDGDGSGDYIDGVGNAERYFEKDKGRYYEYYGPARLLKGVQIEGVPSIKIFMLLDLRPSATTYHGVNIGDEWRFQCVAWMDVTGDGRRDAIVKYENYPFEDRYFYIENISESTINTCETDVNNDGTTNVTDLLAVVSNWGTCEK